MIRFSLNPVFLMNQPESFEPSSDPNTDVPVSDDAASPTEENSCATGSCGCGDEPAPTPEEKNMVLIAHLSGLLVGFVGSLIIWLIHKDKSAYVAEEAKEALNFQITIAIAAVASTLLIFACVGLILLPAVCIANIVFTIIAALKTHEGERYRYPYTLHLVK